MKKAFTLAEVLITLGIIGVVAALTIPMLVQNYRRRDVEVKLERTYSIVNQAIKLSTIENEEAESWGNLEDNENYAEVEAWFMKYLAPYLKYSHITEYKNDNLVVHLYDGTALRFQPKNADIFLHIKPKCLEKGGCAYGKWSFYFRFSPNHNPVNPNDKYMKNPNFEPYMYNWDGTYEGAKSESFEQAYGCFDKYHALCTKLIQLNGWKIPKDYPYKF